MSTSAARKTAILSMKRITNRINPNILRKILEPIPELEERNFKNKMNREGFVQLNGNIWYHIPNSKSSKNVNKFYIKNQGYKNIKNVKQNVLNNLKFAVGVHYNNIPRAEHAPSPMLETIKYFKLQLKAVLNDLRKKSIFKLSTTATSVKRKRK